MNEHKDEQRANGITPQAVRAQLRTILASDTFVRSGRMRRFLEFVVEETLAGRADQLAEYGIGVSVFDRGADFDPAVDPIVRNDARRLRLKLLEYYSRPSDEAENSLLIDIPKGGYVPVFQHLRLRAAQTNMGPRLAVLPFEVLSTAPDDAMYTRSLCMSLTAKLTSLDGLEAIAHGYLREMPIRQAASELRLSHAIHGSVSACGDRRRVVISLIQIPDGAQLWAREYDFENGEILRDQSEIAGTVLREVSTRLGISRSQTARLAMAA